MAKVKSIFVCSECGATSPKWIGKCPSCSNWNAYNEEIQSTSSNSVEKGAPVINQNNFPIAVSRINPQQQSRFSTGISELNRVLGGGLVPGAMVLLGGEPGIGKSTLLLQMAMNCGKKVLYISGEESPEQIKLRAERIAGNNDECYVLSETLLENVLYHIEHQLPEIVIIDSIQTLQTEKIESSAGSVTQIRECASGLLNFTKKKHIPVFLVGHINKEGSIAGPKVLEHVVDTVLQFEGDRNNMFRILRSAKNRFGSTSELGIFEMRNDGLVEVTNPSELLMSFSTEPLSGIAIAGCIEGLRPFMIEVQALVSTAAYGTPQRSSTGFDLRRLSMLLAVLEKRAGFRLATKDVFLNIAGGIKVDDTAIDLAIICAILSSDLDFSVPKEIAFAGEVGLSGEIRPVNRIEQRIGEAQKLGFTKVLISKYTKVDFSKFRIEIIPVGKVEEAFRVLFKKE